MAEKRRPGGKTEGLGKGDRRRLRQLVVCLILFGVVFVGRGIDLGPVGELSSAVSLLVETDTDFQALFAQVGESFSQGAPAVETFKSLWSGVTGGEETKKPPEQTAPQTTQQGEKGGEDVAEKSA